MKKYSYNQRYKAISKAKRRNNLLSEVGSGSIRSLDFELFQQDILAKKYSARRPVNIYCPQCRLVTGRAVTLERRNNLREHLLDHRIHRALGDEQAWLDRHIPQGSGRFHMHCKDATQEATG